MAHVAMAYMVMPYTRTDADRHRKADRQTGTRGRQAW